MRSWKTCEAHRSDAATDDRAGAADTGGAASSAPGSPITDARKPRVAITYCRQCNWLLRAAWMMAQELLSTFADDLGEVALVPGTGGAFEIVCDGEPIWDRKRDGGFPDARTLKRRIRDRLDPDRDLGHVDR